jgi:3-oxoacyl-[acyl-carrier protein] reductase
VEIKGMNAIVTGSSRGIGKAIALELAGRGANVVVCCRRQVEAAAEVERQVKSKGVRAIMVQSDLGTEEGARLVVERSTADLGGVDILVNNAGMGLYGPVHLLDVKEIEATLRVNLFSYINLARLAVGDMIERGTHGCVVNLSSVLSMVGIPGTTVYAASKGGIEAFSRSLAREVVRHGIRVNSIAPGFITTEMNLEWTDEYRARIIGRIPMRRFGEPEEIARAVTFLLEDATYMTGQTLVLDGGMTVD